jgi:hypothetical protein
VPLSQDGVNESTDGVKIIDVKDAILPFDPVTIVIRPSHDVKRAEYHSRNTLSFQ